MDVAVLAAANESSYEMARRYAEGMALPRVDVARAFLLGFALGAVVGVCAAWL